MRISPSKLSEILTYDPLSGSLFWLHRIYARPSINSQLSGKPALHSLTKDGYRHGKILGRTYLAHIVIWAITKGAWPDHEIDHKNGIRSDNRIVNLRRASSSQNSMNSKMYKNNKTGLKGVVFHRQSGKWRARISSNKKSTSLGLFSTPQDAHEAYKIASKEMHKDFGRTS